MKNSIPDLPVLDLEGACEFLEISMQHLMILLPEALREMDATMAQLRLSVPAGDSADVSRNAHIIKSVAASIGATPASLAAEGVERAALGRSSGSCLKPFAALEAEMKRLDKAVGDLS